MIIMIALHWPVHAFWITVGVPRLMRTDCGTENTNISFIQPFLRRNHTDCYSGLNSFRYGKSVSNQVSVS